MASLPCVALLVRCTCCRASFLAALQLLGALSTRLNLVEAKRIRQQVLTDATLAARQLTTFALHDACTEAQALDTTLHRRLPEKQGKRVHQLLSRAIISTKRAPPMTARDAASGAELLGLPADVLARVCLQLAPADLAAVCCTCRCASLTSYNEEL